jgi:hypothetical protein
VTTSAIQARDGLFASDVELFRPMRIESSEGAHTMNERQTLSILGWVFGVVIAVTFILDAIALTPS